MERAIDYLERAAGQGNPTLPTSQANYCSPRKISRISSEPSRTSRSPRRTVTTTPEYQLGKLYLYGREIDRDYHKAMEYLQSAADKGNPYAKQLLHSIKSNRHWSAAMGSFRLLHHLARMLQNQLEDERKEKLGGIDRKLKRKIVEKKQAHGLKQ